MNGEEWPGGDGLEVRKGTLDAEQRKRQELQGMSL